MTCWSRTQSTEEKFILWWNWLIKYWFKPYIEYWSTSQCVFCNNGGLTVHYLAYYTTTYIKHKYLDMKYWFKLFIPINVEIVERKNTAHILQETMVSHMNCQSYCVAKGNGHYSEILYVTTEYYNWPIRIEYSWNPCDNIH